MSYEKEKQELGEWYRQKTQEYLDALDEENLGGLDSPLDAVHKQDTMEFNRRLRELQKKYGVRPPAKSLTEVMDEAYKSGKFPARE